jgi:hypothetical protein
MEKLMTIKFKYWVMVAWGWASISHGAEQAKEETEFGFSPKSPVSISSDEEELFGWDSSRTSLSDSEAEGEEKTAKKSHVKKAREFFENRRQKKSFSRSGDSDYESEEEESVSAQRGPSLKKQGQNPEDQEKMDALKELSKKLNNQLPRWNDFESQISDDDLQKIRQSARQEFEEFSEKFVQENPILSRSDTKEEIQSLILRKLSRIKSRAVSNWEVWKGRPN